MAYFLLLIVLFSPIFAHASDNLPRAVNLSMEQRVAFQVAIEKIYWEHRVWPAGSSSPKPEFSAELSERLSVEKVNDYMRKSRVLVDLWNSPVTPQDLQDEMTRMAQQTKNPGMLKELFAALKDDPRLIAECLVRPLLVDHRIRSRFAADQLIHAPVRIKAEQESIRIKTPGDMNQGAGRYQVSTFRQRAAQPRRPGSIGIGEEKWTSFKNHWQEVEVGRVGALQENDSNFYRLALIERNNDSVQVASVAWPKQTFDSWWAQERNSIPVDLVTPAYAYTHPTISADAGCSADRWLPLDAPPQARYGHSAVWTGAEMIVWGGSQDNYQYFNTGGIYDPATDSWKPTSLLGAPSPRQGHVALWTGTEMFVWGGGSGPLLQNGGRYDPFTDTWTSVSTVNAPSKRYAYSAVWTGTEAILWGGRLDFNSLNTGSRYNPATNSWTSISTTGAPSKRYYHSAVWTGSRMLIWGGTGSPDTNAGGSYDPQSDTWLPLTNAGAPTARSFHAAAWTGTEMVIWGGTDGGSYLNTGGKYNPTTGTWTSTSMTNSPERRSGFSAVWSGNELLIWGGSYLGILNTGVRYNPLNDTWTWMTTGQAPRAREHHTAVWTGSEMIVWGGFGFPVHLDTGGRYNPATDSWTPTSTGLLNTPEPRELHTAIWTGAEMIIWGGSPDAYPDISAPGTGGKYDPATDSWTPTSLVSAPTYRYFHTAVWTGSRMIVWGGANSNTLGSGALYDPVSNAWVPMSETNSPGNRELHTAVWSGTEMIVWGGTGSSPPGAYHTGGRYNPETDTWILTSTVEAPRARFYHSAVWTGTEMIIWGGDDYFGSVNSGGRYNPITDRWTALPLDGAPEPRAYHSATWTGVEMLIWGAWGLGQAFTDGGRYNPATNTWSAISSLDAPSSRAWNTGIWTGREFIIWGGYLATGGALDDGGRYSPDRNAWIPTTNEGAPYPRYRHSSVWTGNQVIVWGGYPLTRSGAIYCASSCLTSMDLDRTSYGCSDEVKILMDDSDLAGTGAYPVEAWSETEPDPEAIQLMEDPGSSGIFRGAFSLTPAPAVPDNGQVSVSNAETINVRANDASACGVSNVQVERTAIVDCQGPAISNVTVTDVTQSTATITWITSEPADSMVTFGTSVPPSMSQSSVPGFARTTHAMVLVDLSPCTTYYFSVTSADSFGNSTTDTSEGNYFTFRTVRSTYALALDNVEMDPEGWEVVTVAGDSWHRDTCRSYSGSYSWKAGAAEGICPGQYQASTDTYLISPEIHLGPTGHGYHLRTHEYFSLAPHAASRIEITTNGGSTWITIGGNVNNSGGWIQKDYDLAFYQGDVRIRFRLWGIIGSDEGWYLDDVEISRVEMCAIKLESIELEDSCALGGFSDQNGYLDPGEDGTLNFFLRNALAATATAVVATLTTATPGISILNPTVNMPDIPLDGSVSGAEPFQFNVSKTVACGTSVDFTLLIVANEGSWEYEIPVAVTPLNEGCSGCFPDFSISCNPASFTAYLGETAQTACAVTTQDGYSMPQTLQCTGLPLFAYCSFAPNPIAPPQASTMYLNVWDGIPEGNYDFRVSTSDGVLLKQTPLSISISRRYYFRDEFDDDSVSWKIRKGLWREEAQSFSGSGKTAIAYAPEPWLDGSNGCSICTFELQVEIAGGDADVISIQPWYQDPSNRLELIIKESYDKWILKQIVNGTVVGKTKTISPVSPGTSYPLQLSYDGTAFEVRLRGIKIMTLPAAGNPFGGLGLKVKNTTGTFRSVKVY